MKKDIHPKYNTATKVSCACGNAFTTGSTQDEIKTELCSACHPFYTGKQKLIDTTRRVEKFENKKELSAKVGENRKSKKEKYSAKAEAKASKKVAK